MFDHQQVFCLSNGVTADQGVFVEPLAVCIHCITMADIWPGMSVAVYGKIPYTSTFAAFGSLRCVKIIRTDIAQSESAIVGIRTIAGPVGGGYLYYRGYRRCVLPDK